jgi:hypothetical protein
MPTIGSVYKEDQMGGVANRVALVTGAGSETGIGFAIAKLLKAAGHNRISLSK